MRFLLATMLTLAVIEGQLQQWMSVAIYPVLLGTLVIASLGLPIPEDIPLILAGVVLKTSPENASWPLVIMVALIGIMSGDLVLYSAGKRWGRDVVKHRWVRSLVTPARFDYMVAKFHRYGTWMCFFGRFFMGIRAAMCITAGATRFPYWRFFLADFAGALLSVPFFVWLGYVFADMLPTLKEYMADAQWILFLVAALLIGGYIWYEVRHRRKIRLANEQYEREHPELAQQDHTGGPSRPDTSTEPFDATRRTATEVPGAASATSASHPPLHRPGTPPRIQKPAAVPE